MKITENTYILNYNNLLNLNIIHYKDFNTVNYNFAISLNQILKNETLEYIYKMLLCKKIHIEHINNSVYLYGFANFLPFDDMIQYENEVLDRFKALETLLLENGSNFKLYFLDDYKLYFNYKIGKKKLNIAKFKF